MCFYRAERCIKFGKGVKKYLIGKYIQIRLADSLKFPMMTEEKMQVEFGEKIRNKIPFCAGKLGAVELAAMLAEETNWMREKRFEQLNINAGFFPRDIGLLPDFVDVMKTALAQMDYINLWQSKGEKYFVKKYGPSTIKNCSGLGVWASSNPWSKHLEGKKVLVIHPYENSIKEQYRKREKLFSDENTLPEFELKTLKAVQTIGDATDERFQNWFQALFYMQKEAAKLDFDVALIGCGAYGLPLASFLKEQGKIAIHMGGDVQMLFGIMGRRWEKNEVAMKLVNSHWKYPDISEVPEGSKKIENGCYW